MQTQILGLLTPVMGLLFAVTFAVLWRAGRMKRHVLGFALGYLFFSIGYLFTHLLPGDAPYTFHTTQLFYSIGVTFFVASTCERVGQRVHMPTLAAIYVASATVLALAISVTDNVGPRLILINIGYGAMFLVNLTTLLQVRSRDWTDRAIIALTALNVADFFIRPTLSVMFEQTIPAEVYQQSVYYSLIGLVLGIKSIAGAMVLIGATIVDLTNSLRESSQRDPLTGLNNRAAFEDQMRILIPRAHNESRPLSLVVADIDHFKQVNDIWGHQAGDKAITAFGRLIEETVRGCDVAGRVGGEEFCIAVWNCPNEPAERLAERIRVAFAQLEHGEIRGGIRLTASLGLATAREGETYDGLFSRADEALYRAKDGGRNRVENAESDRVEEREGPAAAEPQPLRHATVN
ncbi:MAG: GGDEF domain-containing protein [Erythrobacter sp.]